MTTQYLCFVADLLYVGFVPLGDLLDTNGDWWTFHFYIAGVPFLFHRATFPFLFLIY